MSVFLFPSSGVYGTADSAIVVEPSDPAVLDFNSMPKESVRVGEQVMISVSLKNWNQSNVSFTTIIEVRELSGVTESLFWQSATLKEDRERTIAVSWIPREEGVFELRTFCLSGLTDERRVYSIVHSSELAISR
ncbi:MAG: hypothetical protein ACREBU_02485 [Nitrososphaera sp.]